LYGRLKGGVNLAVFRPATQASGRAVWCHTWLHPLNT